MRGARSLLYPWFSSESVSRDSDVVHPSQASAEVGQCSSGVRLKDDASWLFEVIFMKWGRGSTFWEFFNDFMQCCGHNLVVYGPIVHMVVERLQDESPGPFDRLDTVDEGGYVRPHRLHELM